MAKQEELLESNKAQPKRVWVEEGLALNIDGQELLDPKILEATESSPPSEELEEIKACSKQFAAMLAKWQRKEILANTARSSNPNSISNHLGYSAERKLDHDRILPSFDSEGDAAMEIFDIPDEEAFSTGH